MRHPASAPVPLPSLAPASRHGAGATTLVERVATWARFLVDAPTAFTRPEGAGVRRLVFVCRANLVRSAYAQALCAQAGIRAGSFGLQACTGQRTFALPARVAAAMGASMEAHRARHWCDFEPDDGDLYLAMEPSQAATLLHLGFPHRRIALLGHWSQPRRLHIRDPHGTSELEMRSCFALIRSAVERLSAEMRAPGAERLPAGGRVTAAAAAGCAS